MENIIGIRIGEIAGSGVVPVGNFLLLETGDYRLLETGDRRLLES